MAHESSRYMLAHWRIAYTGENFPQSVVIKHTSIKSGLPFAEITPNMSFHPLIFKALVVTYEYYNKHPDKYLGNTYAKLEPKIIGHSVHLPVLISLLPFSTSSVYTLVFPFILTNDGFYHLTIEHIASSTLNILMKQTTAIVDSATIDENASVSGHWAFRVKAEDINVEPSELKPLTNISAQELETIKQNFAAMQMTSPTPVQVLPPNVSLPITSKPVAFSFKPKIPVYKPALVFDNKHISDIVDTSIISYEILASQATLYFTKLILYAPDNAQLIKRVLQYSAEWASEKIYFTPHMEGNCKYTPHFMDVYINGNLYLSKYTPHLALAHCFAVYTRRKNGAVFPAMDTKSDAGKKFLDELNAGMSIIANETAKAEPEFDIGKDYSSLFMFSLYEKYMFE